jgi:hypothetical protein
MITKIYNIIRAGLVCCCVTAALTSCDSELDIQKHGNLGSMDDFYTNDENTMQATASLYTQMRDLYYTWYYTKNLLSDDVWCGGGSRGDNGDMEKINEYTFDTDNGMIQGLYSGLYGVIYKANLIIDKIEGETPVMKRAIAEAKVFRAWAHFELASLWGTAPVVDHLLTPDEYRQGNSEPGALWAIVESDLTDAINSGTLPSKSDTNDHETGIRATKEFAQALLGKAYLFEGKNSEAASMLDNVINSGKYALFTGDYDMQFHAPNNNNCESLFELQKRNDQENVAMDFMFIMQGWRTDVLSYSGQAANILAQGMYGFMNPRKSLYDAFVAWEGANGKRLNKTIMTYDQVENFGVKLQAGKFLYGSEGYFLYKNQAFKEDLVIDFSGFQCFQFTDLKVMRYAEVLLLAAEAQLQAGNANKALDYINQVRTRAGETPLASVSLSDIKNEKRFELCIECIRFQDLIRWGEAENVMKEQGKDVPVFATTGTDFQFHNQTYGFKSKHNLLPFPLKEIELNPNMTQNPGW